jgi:hypothetical protein
MVAMCSIADWPTICVPSSARTSSHEYADKGGDETISLPMNATTEGVVLHPTLFLMTFTRFSPFFQMPTPANKTE